jgi:hypothetical protein
MPASPIFPVLASFCCMNMSSTSETEYVIGEQGLLILALLVSEILPFFKRVRGHGIIHTIVTALLRGLQNEGGTGEVLNGEQVVAEVLSRPPSPVRAKLPDKAAEVTSA